MEKDAALVVKDVVNKVLEAKENGAYQQLVNDLKPHFADFLNSIHYVKDWRAIQNKLEQFDNLPGSYRLSCFLACYDGVGFSYKPGNRSFRLRGLEIPVFRPILPRNRGVFDRDEVYKMIGKDYLAYLKTINQERTGYEESIGRDIHEHWPTDWTEAIYMAINKKRPVYQKFLQTDIWWRNRGYKLIDIKKYPRFFTGTDYTINDCVIFPQRLLEESGSVGSPSEEEMCQSDKPTAPEDNHKIDAAIYRDADHVMGNRTTVKSTGILDDQTQGVEYWSSDFEADESEEKVDHEVVAIGTSFRGAARGPFGGAVESSVRRPEETVVRDGAIGANFRGAARGPFGGAIGTSIRRPEETVVRDGAIGTSIRRPEETVVRDGAIGANFRGAARGPFGGAVESSLRRPEETVVRGTISEEDAKFMEEYDWPIVHFD